MSATELVFRLASRQDLETLVGLLADDPLGAQRERVQRTMPDAYGAAFDAIAADPNQELVVAEQDGEVAGLLQLTFIPSLTYLGGWRAQIEGVRVARARRGEGVGRALLQQAIDRARSRDCVMVQLTSDKRRPDAIAFYERLGFRATHEGMKLMLREP